MDWEFKEAKLLLKLILSCEIIWIQNIAIKKLKVCNSHLWYDRCKSVIISLKS